MTQVNTDKFRFMLLFSVGFLALICFSAGCRSTQTAAPLTVQKVSRQFGEPGPGKIAVTVKGNVKREGLYYLDQGADLDSLLSLSGLKYRQGEDGYVDTASAVVHRVVNGKSKEIHHSIRTKEQRKAVQLKDGDSVFVKIRIFQKNSVN